MTWTFRWLRTWPEVWSETNLARWLRAFDKDSGAHVTPFMHPHVVRAWVNSHGDEDYCPFFFWASHPDGRHAFHLLVRRRGQRWRDFTREVVSVGTDKFDYSDPVFLPSEHGVVTFDVDFWHALEREMQKHQGEWFDVFCLPRIRTTCLDGSACTDQGEVAPFVRLDRFADIDAYLKSRHRTFRKSLRRRLAKCHAAGEITFITHGASDRDVVLSWIPAFVRELMRKYPREQSVEHWVAYFSNLASEGLPNGVVNCSSITVDGRSASWEFNFTLNDVLYGYAGAFDPSYSHVSLGSVHTLKTIDWAIQQKFRLYDFLWGDEEYKRHWTDGEKVDLNRFKLRSWTPGSMLRLAAAYGDRKLLRRRKSVTLLSGVKSGKVQAEGNRQS
jgi:hypothetical protein